MTEKSDADNREAKSAAGIESDAADGTNATASTLETKTKEGEVREQTEKGNLLQL